MASMWNSYDPFSDWFKKFDTFVNKDLLGPFVGNDDLKENIYFKMAREYGPMIAKWGSAILPLLAKHNLWPVISQGIAYIEAGIAGFAALAILKHAIDHSLAGAVQQLKKLLAQAFQYIDKRKIRIERLLDEIEGLITEVKVANYEFTQMGDAWAQHKLGVLMIRLNEKIRICSMDIRECLEKIEELSERINSTMAALSEELATSKSQTVVLGVTTAVLFISGLGIIGVGTGGACVGSIFRQNRLSMHLTECIRIKGEVDALRNDLERMKKRLEEDAVQVQ